MDRIYFPATINILTKGHIVLLEKLLIKGDVVVGLLTPKALKGYKKELVPYEDRRFILDNLALSHLIEIVPQDSLDPTANCKKYKCTAIASGDGWEKSEREAIKKLGLKEINIKSGEKIHSSDILKK